MKKIFSFILLSILLLPSIGFAQTLEIAKKWDAVATAANADWFASDLDKSTSAERKAGGVFLHTEFPVKHTLQIECPSSTVVKVVQTFNAVQKTVYLNRGKKIRAGEKIIDHLVVHTGMTYNIQHEHSTTLNCSAIVTESYNVDIASSQPPEIGFGETTEPDCPDDGVTDAYQCWHDAITELEDSGISGRIHCKDGRYRITDTLDFKWASQNPPFSFGSNRPGSTNTGGTGGCQFIADLDDADKPLFRLRGLKFPHFHDISITASSALGAVFQLETLDGHTTRYGTLKRIRADCTSNGWCKYGMRLVDGDSVGATLTPAGDGPDGNNDFHHCEDCEFINYTLAGVSQEHSQAKNNLYENLRVVGDESTFLAFDWATGDDRADGPYGVTTALGTGGGQAGNGGSFKIENCEAQNNVSDFYVKNPADTIYIQSCLSEGTGRLGMFGADGESSVNFPVNIIDHRFHMDADNPPTDNRILEFGWRGPFNIFGSTLKSNTSNHLQVYAATQDAVINAKGNTIAKTGATFAGTFTGDSRHIHALENVYGTAGTANLDTTDWKGEIFYLKKSRVNVDVSTAAASFIVIDDIPSQSHIFGAAIRANTAITGASGADRFGLAHDDCTDPDELTETTGLTKNSKGRKMNNFFTGNTRDIVLCAMTDASTAGGTIGGASESIEVELHYFVTTDLRDAP